MSIRLLKKIAIGTVNNAGPRYTPNLDKHAPNLEIKFLIDSIECLQRGEGLALVFQQALDEIQNNFTSDKTRLNKYIRSKKNGIASIITSLTNYLVLPPNENFQDLKTLKNAINYCYNKLENHRSKLWSKKHQEKKDQENYINGEIYLMNKWISMIKNLDEIVNSKYYELSNSPYLLISGRAGTGKTHLLCDLTLKKLNAKKPILMVLAQDFNDINDPLGQIAKETGFAKNKQLLLEKLASLANKLNERALIIIDGINEGDYNGWKKHFSLIMKDLKKYPQIGLVISSRTPHERIFCDKEYKNKILTLYHPGFEGIEFDATTEFFHHYKIPTPDYPLLDSEFSNPLFLKIACEALKEISENQKKRRLTEIASGLKTITTLFEDYVKHCTAHIEEQYQLSPRTCWNIIKGKEIEINNLKTDVGISSTMAKEGREWVYPNELKYIIQKHTNLVADNLEKFYMDFLSLGVVISDFQWEENNRQILRLPYQRISDHIIARSLLRYHL
jgi:hypothetical protein